MTAGTNIINILKKQLNGAGSQGRTAILEFEVALPERDNVNLELVFTAGDANAYEFLSTFGDIMQYFGENFKFTPIYYSNSLKDLGIEDNKDQSECLDADKKFCLLTGMFINIISKRIIRKLIRMSTAIKHVFIKMYQ